MRWWQLLRCPKIRSAGMTNSHPSYICMKAMGSIRLKKERTGIWLFFLLWVNNIELFYIKHHPKTALHTASLLCNNLLIWCLFREHDVAGSHNACCTLKFRTRWELSEIIWVGQLTFFLSKLESVTQMCCLFHLGENRKASNRLEDQWLSGTNVQGVVGGK